MAVTKNINWIENGNEKNHQFEESVSQPVTKKLHTLDGLRLKEICYHPPCESHFLDLIEVTHLIQDQQQTSVHISTHQYTSD